MIFYFIIILLFCKKQKKYFIYPSYVSNIFVKKKNVLISNFNSRGKEYRHVYPMRPLLAILYNIIAPRYNIVFSCEQEAVRISEDELIAIAITRTPQAITHVCRRLQWHD